MQNNLVAIFKMKVTVWGCVIKQPIVSANLNNADPFATKLCLMVHQKPEYIGKKIGMLQNSTWKGTTSPGDTTKLKCG